MDAVALIARLLEQREFMLELEPGLRVKLRRPAEAELGAYLRGVREADTHLRCVVGWEGFSEATLLGPAIGSADPLPFDASAWLVAAADRGEWIASIAQALGEAIDAHAKQREATAKNSTPSSTRKTASSGRAKTNR